MTEYNIIYLLCQALRTYAIFKLMGAFFQRDEVNKKLEFALLSIYYIIVGGVYIACNIPLVTLAANIICLLLITFCYRSSIKRRIFALAFIYTIMIVIEAVVYFIISLLQLKENLMYFAAQIAVTMLYYMTALILSKTKLLKDFDGISLIQWAAMIFVPIITIVLSIAPLLLKSEVGLPLLCLIISAAMFLVSIIVFYLYDELLKSAKINLENELVLQQNHAYEKQLNIIYQSEENLRTFRHDIKNHLNSLEKLIDNNKVDEAKNYIEAAFDVLSVNFEYCKSGNYAVDSILNFKVGQGMQQGLNIELNVAVPAELNITAFDLNAIIGNLMDNAICAACDTEQKSVTIKIYFECEVLFIEIDNSYSGVINRVDGKFISSKKDADTHGIGIFSVERAVRKYTGELSFTYDNAIFIAKAMLFNIKL